MTISNLPLPDQLAAIRAEIKALEDKESELRRLLLTNADLRTGAHWHAEVTVTRRDTLDLKELKACHPDLVAAFTHSLPVERIVLSGISEDGELIPARKFKQMTQDG